jgi:hypothetical protein
MKNLQRAEILTWCYMNDVWTVGEYLEFLEQDRQERDIINDFLTNLRD